MATLKIRHSKNQDSCCSFEMKLDETWVAFKIYPALLSLISTSGTPKFKGYDNNKMLLLVEIQDNEGISYFEMSQYRYCLHKQKH